MSEPQNPPKPSEPLKEGGMKTPPIATPPEETPTPDGERGGGDAHRREGGMIGEG